MLVYGTLTEAMKHRRRSGATGLVLSLDGALYFVFHSYQSREQLASSSARAHINITNELHTKFHDPNFKPSSDADQAKWADKVFPFANKLAEQLGLPEEGRHAEEMMIENWSLCCDRYREVRKGPPKMAEVFLEFCPCQITNANASTAKMLAGHNYPRSCKEKLLFFTQEGDRASMKWRIYWDQMFHGQSFDLQNDKLKIIKTPDYVAKF